MLTAIASNAQKAEIVTVSTSRIECGRSDFRTEAEQIELASPEDPLLLESGGALDLVRVEFECYGRLNSSRSNGILITHALSGDAHAAGWDLHAAETGRAWRTRKPGWWDAVIGPGKAIDTDRWCVICSNVLGSCYGTTGPSSIDPAGERPYGLRFPVVTVGDWVRLQARLLDSLGIRRLHAVIGGSLGGQQALEWALAYPDRVGSCVIFAASPRLSAQGLAFNAVGRAAILNDTAFLGGDYYDADPPRSGLVIARMLAHITYLSEEGMHRKFGRSLQDEVRPSPGFNVEFAVESYLAHQGQSFVERFDANSYLYLTRAMDYYDAAEQWGDGDLVTACHRIQSRMMVVSFSSDWLYPPAHCKELAMAISRAGHSVTYVNVPSVYGHDAFLVETGPVGKLARSFIDA